MCLPAALKVSFGNADDSIAGSRKPMSSVPALGRSTGGLNRACVISIDGLRRLGMASHFSTIASKCSYL